MEINKTFLIAGGDLRQVYLAEVLTRFYKVYAIGFDKNIINSDKVTVIDSFVELNQRVDFIVLPLPVSADGVNVNTPYGKGNIPLEVLTSVIKEEGIVFGGKFNEKILKIFNDKKIDAVDYFEREELTVLNAVPMALYKLHI